MDKINNCIVISDIHAGCQFGLCPDEVELDGGGYYKSSKYQKFLLKCWYSFWDDWVPKVTRGEPYCVVLNGDALDGRHHGATTQVSQNLADQHNIAAYLLKPIVEKCDGRFYFIRGTEVHTGQSSENEEKLAKELKAIKDENGRYSRNELYLRVGKCLAHFNHHIGVTGSLAHESTAP
ncbi:MAG: hypothetical protein KKC77_19230, partial [Proteobacteria bacterium]|nr:hypothetical protein [Pseudomonadota bacterium]